MKQNLFTSLHFALLLTATAASLLACRRDEVSSPAVHIRNSEKLAIPEAVSIPTSSTRIATFYATGVQQYKAREVAGSPGQYEWVFVAPQAELFDAKNKSVGTHGAGPHWTLAATDSVFGQAFTPARTAPSPDAQSIDWLLLKPKAGTTPTGIFKDVAFIQRMATEGGKAPATAPTSATQTANVAYKAVYRFSR